MLDSERNGLPGSSHLSAWRANCSCVHDGAGRARGHVGAVRPGAPGECRHRCGTACLEAMFGWATHIPLFSTRLTMGWRGHGRAGARTEMAAAGRRRRPVWEDDANAPACTQCAVRAVCTVMRRCIEDADARDRAPLQSYVTQLNTLSDCSTAEEMPHAISATPPLPPLRKGMVCPRAKTAVMPGVGHALYRPDCCFALQVFCVWCCKRYTNIDNLEYRSPARVCAM